MCAIEVHLKLEHVQESPRDLFKLPILVQYVS